jgi:predicted nucleic acid-binding Zn finger protein
MLVQGLSQPEAGTYVVQASDQCGGYLVRTGGLSCTCPDHQQRGVTCKHIAAVVIAQAVADELRYLRLEARARRQCPSCQRHTASALDLRLIASDAACTQCPVAA